ncbi:hypothetical protein [Flavobacterium mesophilum]|uniref:hypothetical protein n=1 Tax=Flavobacterium mesophilum TaxID=3143495 RepID=UPI0031D36301
MKKTLLIALLFVGLNCLAQGTTSSEYVYASKIYADAMKVGAEVAPEYKIEPVLTPKQSKTIESIGGKKQEVARYSFLFKMIRVETGKVAAFILQEKRPDTNYSNYYAIPNKEAASYIWTQAQNDFAKRAESNKCENSGSVFSYDWNLVRYLAEALSN